MKTKGTHKERNIFIDGPIDPLMIAKSIASHSGNSSIGAHEFFLGQIRGDVIEGIPAEAIEYNAYKEMALAEMLLIREETFSRWPITCLHVHHSLGRIPTGAICFMVFASSPHRNAAREAVAYVTDQVKERLPIFGKEILLGGAHAWKVNH
ncbi:MAG: molybdenum cofactor biosynthesis protein MoaE [Bacteroidota bacterium]|nr:molybdenum cofactor biosynthesis protein MoaE [Bacteroidota bacterium]